MRKSFLSLVAGILVTSLAAAAGGTSSPVPAASADEIPSGYVWLSGGSVGVGIGYAWAHGTLYYNKDQKEYRFKVSGVSVADVGAAGINAEGEVYNLADPSDLSGEFSAVTAGLTVGAGGSVAYLKNDKGVVIKLHSQTGGVRFNLAASGMRVALQN